MARSARFVITLFREELPDWAVYHNIAHTSEVVAATWEIGEGSGLNARELEIVLIAAWFHDTGYTLLARGHEEKSIDIASKFLGENGYPEREIGRVSRCIRATRMPQRPRTLLERVLCDADLKSLGRRSFFRQNDQLKAEIERREGILLDEALWLRRSYRFLTKHRFHTRHARAEYDDGRLANIVRMERLLKKLV